LSGTCVFLPNSAKWENKKSKQRKKILVGL